MPNNTTATPPPSYIAQDNPPPPDSPSGGMLNAWLDAEREGERWVRLDKETLLRAADFRTIRQGQHSRSERVVEGRRRRATWPLPSLKINNDLELLYPQWTVEELLLVIGADVVEAPRTANQIEWQIGEPISGQD